MIVAQGWEAGGHVWGTIATLPLVPAVVDAVDPTPVIAAGGIGDGRGVAAVLALGAQAAWVGTRFLLAQEAPLHAVYRDQVMAASETDANWYADLYDVEWPDAPHSAPWATPPRRRGSRPGSPPPGRRPGRARCWRTDPIGEPVVRYASTTALAGITGDIDALSLWAGQSVALASERRPAAEIVTELCSRI